jgi:hypothetical protein
LPEGLLAKSKADELGFAEKKKPERQVISNHVRVNTSWVQTSRVLKGRLRGTFLVSGGADTLEMMEKSTRPELPSEAKAR